MQYSRHLRLSGFGVEKQKCLRNARVLLVGAGGLGCPIGLYLAAAGVGTIGVVDFDHVELSNLQRQIAHSEARLGQGKVKSLITSMEEINSLLRYEAHDCKVTADNVTGLIANYDLVIDGSDNYATRFLLADACYLQKKPLLQGSVYEYQGQIALFASDEGACYRCVFETPPQRNGMAPCAEIGVLGVVPGTVGVMMATEAIKYLTGLGQSIIGNLLIYDALAQTTRQVRLSRNVDCPLCGENPSIVSLKVHEAVCRFSENEDALQVSVSEAKTLLGQKTLLLDVREEDEFLSGHMPNALLLPLGALSEQTVSQSLKKNQPVLVYCQKGQRSLKAVQLLRDWGYQEAVSLQGGIEAWQAYLIECELCVSRY